MGLKIGHLTLHFQTNPCKARIFKVFLTGNHCGIMVAPLVLHFTTAFGQKSGMESCPNWHQIEKREKHNEKLSFKKIASKKKNSTLW